ncbi:phospholipase D/Transphosphatidylase [Oceanithermus profundus DSM 14977]|uniref:phospholipase D n=1 Tax=Oceanithermus profundus (strain DSM 14977 / NBRC 100410 / VKM B-2274 / 506) TaxID=670487 RepID=E4U820_OCEP5|nr:phospholipase D-like domain-containing protein [Oceanithermus profundus]ADR36110.1 phospholipase D/Transphosphatidylase [Oceanithermus profundus DSM 14977]
MLAGIALWQQRSGYTNPPPPGEVRPQVYFLPEDEERAVEALGRALARSERTVDLALLTLNDTRLGYLLAQTAARGVRVRIFSEREHREDTLTTLLAGSRGQTAGRPRVRRDEAYAQVRRTSENCERLAGVDLCYDDRPGLMHDKFAVLDAREVWTGSTNWSYNGLHKNDNDLLVLTGEPAARLYHAAFAALWRRKPRPPAPATLELDGGGRLSVFFSPGYGEAALERIVRELDAAEREVWVAAFVLTHPRVLEALNAAARRGVEVRVLLERRNLPDSREEALGPRVEVREDANPAAMHLKTIVIDERTVVTGSFNFTRSAVSRNDENLLVLTHPQLARRYKEKVWQAWRRAGP